VGDGGALYSMTLEADRAGEQAVAEPKELGAPSAAKNVKAK
jgi:hypothetical protein